MKILHLADLHIGKKVNDFSMLEEQKYVLSQACALIKNEGVEAVLIAGDIFDRPIPPLCALEVFDSFLRELNLLKVKVFAISGNHDSNERFSYLSKLLETSDIYFSKPFDGTLSSYSLDDNINIYLMPHLYPALLRKFIGDEENKSYSDLIRALIDSIKLDELKINIILSHQFVTGSKEMILSDSEQKSLGGVDEIQANIFEKFDYCALGHLHAPQKCGYDKVRYSGSILKYSFSEINQKKEILLLDIKGKNDIDFKHIPIKFLHEMKEYRGYINDFLSEDFYKNIDTNDYIHFILLDEYVLDAKKKLSMIYPNIMLLEFDNTFTRNLNSSFCALQASNKSMFEHFCDFYKLQTNNDIDSKKEKILRDILEGGQKCVL